MLLWPTQVLPTKGSVPTQFAHVLCRRGLRLVFPEIGCLSGQRRLQTTQVQETLRNCFSQAHHPEDRIPSLAGLSDLEAKVQRARFGAGEAGWGFRAVRTGYWFWGPYFGTGFGAPIGFNGESMSGNRGHCIPDNLLCGHAQVSAP